MFTGLFAFGDQSIAQTGTPKAQVCASLADPTLVPFAILKESDLDAVLSACLLAKVADPADLTTQANLGRVYHARKDYAGARAQYEPAAKAGVLFAMYNLSILYAAGQGGATDEVQAQAWLQEAANGGYIYAQTDLGIRLLQGGGTTADRQRGLSLLRAGAKGGDAYAMGWLGTIYLAGVGVPADPVQAVEWLKKAAEAGDPSGAAQLGSLYLTGKHVSKDDAMALKWLSVAAEAGDGFGMFRLGQMYEDGTGVDPSPRAAALWMLGSLTAGYRHFLDEAYTPDVGTVMSMHEFLIWTGHYKGSYKGKLTLKTREAIDRFLAETDTANYLLKADAYRKYRDDMAEASNKEWARALADAYLKGLTTKAATPASPDPAGSTSESAGPDGISEGDLLCAKMVACIAFEGRACAKLSDGSRILATLDGQDWVRPDGRRIDKSDYPAHNCDAKVSK